ncbi:MAG: OmpA family protein [Myxococcaceae bacterium]
MSWGRHTVVGAAAALAWVVSGCADLSQYTRQGQEITSQYTTDTSRLLEQNRALQARAAKLPAAMSGVSEVTSAIAKNETQLADTTQTTGFTTKLDEVVKAGNGTEAESLVAGQRTMSSEAIARAESDLTALSAQVTALEAQASATSNLTEGKFSRSLTSGHSITGNPTGIESQLITFIEDSSKLVDKTTWFDFDRLTFRTGSADLDMDMSKDQLTNVAEILKAYPNVTLKIGGYTDNRGSAKANKKLSTARATKVVQALTEMGIPANRLSPEGYGASHPVCAANDTEECRAQNRRISVRVAAK